MIPALERHFITSIRAMGEAAVKLPVYQTHDVFKYLEKQSAEELAEGVLVRMAYAQKRKIDLGSAILSVHQSAKRKGK